VTIVHKSVDGFQATWMTSREGDGGQVCISVVAAKTCGFPQEITLSDAARRERQFVYSLVEGLFHEGVGVRA
jgi:hypothetical protein